MAKLDARLDGIELVKRAIENYFTEAEFDECVSADYAQGYRDCAIDIVFVLEGLLESRRGGEDGN